MQTVIIQLKISKQYYNRLSKRRDLRMLESVVEFFKNLPDKVCVQCGEKSKNKVNATAVLVINVTLYKQSLYY